MPAMVAFGRRWTVGTDDLFFMGLVDVIVFFPGLVFNGFQIYYWFYSYRSVCKFPLLFDIFLVALLCSLFIQWVLAISFMHFSSKGAIFETNARSHVVSLFYCKVVVSALDIALAALGTFILYENDFYNIPKVLFAVRVSTTFLWVITGVRAIYGLIIYDSESLKNRNMREQIYGETLPVPVPSKLVQKWKFRFHTLFFWCANFSNAKKDAIDTMSEVFAYTLQWFDFVPSDVIAGFILLHQKGLKKYESEKCCLEFAPMITQPDGTELDCFPTTDMESWMNLHLAQRYFCIGLGVFGWPWVLYRNLSCGLCSLWNKLKCCFSCRKNSIVIGDNCCGCNTAGLQVSSGVPYEDLVHVSFQNSVYKIPFFVCIDPETSAIVITTRGTMSFTDVLTDLAAGFSPITAVDCPPDTLCHSGILKAAKKIKEKLENGILSSAFSGRESYRLITTGHSLGAGVACVLALLLHSRFPSVRCYAFSPPPVISACGLSTTFSFIFTVIFGNDIVPFASFYNIHAMTDEIMQCLKECNLPKHKIFFGCTPELQNKGCLPCSSLENGILNTADSNGYPSCSSDNGTLNLHYNKMSSEEVSGNMKPNPTKFAEAEVIEKENEHMRSENSTQVLKNLSQKAILYVPGKILHIRKLEHRYKLHIAMAQEYCPIVFRPEMFAQHFPQYMEKCLKQLGESYTVLSDTV